MALILAAKETHPHLTVLVQYVCERERQSLPPPNITHFLFMVGRLGS